MASSNETTASLSRANDLLGQLRQAIRKVEVVPKITSASGGGGGGGGGDARGGRAEEQDGVIWTTNAIEVLVFTCCSTESAFSSASAHHLECEMTTLRASRGCPTRPSFRIHWRVVEPIAC